MTWLTLAPFLLFGQIHDVEGVEALIAAQRYREAKELAQRALRRELPDAEARRYRWLIAEACELAGDYEGAVSRYEDLAEEASGRLATEALVRSAKCHLQMWDTERAEKILKDLSSRDVGDLAHGRDEVSAIATFLAGRQREARGLFESLPRKSGTAWHYLGLIAFNSGNFERGVECFDRSIASAGRDADSLLYRGSCLFELNRLAEARSSLDEFLKIADIPEANRLLGQLELRANRFAQAEARFRKALKMSPGNPEAQFGLATALKRQGRAKEAQKAFKRFRDLHVAQQKSLDLAYVLEQQHLARPEDPEPPEKLALHYLAAGDAAEAVRMAWRTLNIDRRRLGARLCLARSLTALGRYRAAATQYERILRNHRGHPAATREYRELVLRHARRVDE